MDETKSTLSSKTILTNLATAILSAIIYFGGGHLGLDVVEALGAITGTTIVGSLVSAFFRKTATARLG